MSEAAEVADRQRLALQEAHGRDLAPDEHQWFEVTLAQGEFAKLALDQESVDVRVTIFGPEPWQPATYDSRWGGAEPALLLAEVSGVYRLEVQAAGKGRKGRYTIRLEEVRRAREEDRASLTVHLDSTRAKQLVDSATPQALEEALSLFAASLPAWRAVGDRAGEAQSLNGIGYVHHRLGKGEAALESYGKALEIRRALPSDHGIGETLHNMAAVYSARGEGRIALELYEEALSHRRAAGDRLGQAATLSNLAAVRLLLNGPDEALDDLADARTLWKALGERRGEGLTLLSLGAVYSTLGAAPEAHRYYQEALQAFHLENDLVGIATVKSNVGFLQQNIEARPREALVSYREAAEMMVKANYTAGRINVLLNIGSAWLQLDDRLQAVQTYQEALRLAGNSGYGRERSIALRALGDIELTAGRLDTARKNLAEASALAQVAGDRRITASVLYSTARLEEKSGNRTLARERIEGALKIIESIRNRVPGEQLRASYLALNRGYYELYVNLLLGPGIGSPEPSVAALALEASERSHARSLLDLLTEGQIDIRQGISPELKRREEETFSRLSTIQSQLLQARASLRPDPAQIARLEQRRKEAEEQERTVEQEIRRLHPDYAQLRYPVPLRLDAIQGLLDAETVLLEYFLDAEACRLFVVSRDGLTVHTLARAREIVPLLRKLLAALPRNDAASYGDYALAARELYKILVQPAEGVIASRGRLLIVPDGELYHLPFECLLTANPRSGAFGDYRRLPYLLQKWSVSYLPSASVLASVREARSKQHGPLRHGKEVMIYADPVFGGQDQQSGKAPDANDRGLLDEIGQISRLKYSGQEATSIAALFAHSDSAVFRRERASEENVKANPELALARRLHFATHAFLRENQPRYSGLVLALDDDPKEDGLLQVYEIFNLPRLENCELVVLSACRTGEGTVLRGEALVGLVRSFLYAGAASIVVTLWQVQDESMSSLMAGFYRHLRQPHQDKSAALRKAKQEAIRSGRFSHPRQWAPVILVGEPR